MSVMDTHQHTASLAEKDSTGEKSSAEEGLASFNTVKYWNDFYDPEQGGDCDEFDWYSTEEWLPQCVEGITASRPHLARDACGHERRGRCHARRGQQRTDMHRWRRCCDDLRTRRSRVLACRGLVHCC